MQKTNVRKGSGYVILWTALLPAGWNVDEVLEGKQPSYALRKTTNVENDRVRKAERNWFPDNVEHHASLGLPVSGLLLCKRKINV